MSQENSNEIMSWEEQNHYLAARGINESCWNVLCNTLYPSNKPESVLLAWEYCNARDLDIMMKPVHLVGMSVLNPATNTKEWRDVVMPGIGLYRIQADRSGNYAGADEPEFGPAITRSFPNAYNANQMIEVTYPEYCKYTVHKIVGDRVVSFSAKEYWEENYATQKAGAICPNAMWQKRPNGQLAKCFDEKTEVLTESGFVKFSEVNSRVLQVTDHGLELTNSLPFSQDYSGEMIEANGTRLNFSVTPNHDMITSLGRIEASELFDATTSDAGKVSIPRAPENNNNDHFVNDEILRLIGYYLADGSHTGYKQFRIAVSRECKINSLMSASNYTRISTKKDAGRVSEIDGREITTKKDKKSFSYDFSIISEFVNKDKSINIEKCLLLSKRQAGIIIDALVEFDGNTNEQGVKRLTQKNINVIASFDVLSQVSCRSISKPAVKNTAYTITLSNKSDFSVVKGVSKNKASLVKRNNATGKVWCVTVPSGKIVVRRDGFSMVCGNCAEAQALRKAWPEVGQEATAEEMEGKELFVNAEKDINPQAVQISTDQKFTEIFDRGVKAIELGNQTANQIISFIKSKGFELPQEKEATLRSIKVAA